MSKQSRRILSPILCTAITLALALLACQAPTIGSLHPVDGFKLSVVVQPSGAAASTSRSLGGQQRLLLPGAASLTVTLTHLSGTMADPQPQTVSIASAATSVPVSFAKLPFATWRIKAEARDAGGALIASQTRQFEFSAASSSATVSLVPVPNNAGVASLPGNESIAGKSSKTWRIPAGAKLFAGPSAYILTTNPLVSVFVQKADGSLVTSMPAGKNLISAPASDFNLDQDLYVTAYNGAAGGADIGMGSDPKMVVMTEHGGTAAGDWVSLAASKDGKNLAACDASSVGAVWTSADYGASWKKTDMGAVRNATSPNLVSIASSADGSRLAVTDNQSSIMFSKDFGGSWSRITQNDGSMQFSDIAANAAGTVLMATDRDFGLKIFHQALDQNWTAGAWIMQSDPPFSSIVCNDQGDRIVVGGPASYKPMVYYNSQNLTEPWQQAMYGTWSSIKQFNGLASNASGSLVAASGTSGGKPCIAISTDYGADWQELYETNATSSFDIACNGDGSRIMAATNEGELISFHGQTFWARASLSTTNSKAMKSLTMTSDTSLINAAVGLDVQAKPGALWTIAQIP